MSNNGLVSENLAGKVAVVTGAASGIGLAMCKAFASKGMNLVLADISQQELSDAEKTVQELGAETLTVVCDVSDASQIQALSNKAYERFGAVNVLCNNAGVGGISVDMKDSDQKTWDWIMGVNFNSVVYAVQSFVNRMLASGEPCHIVNTASIAGLVHAGRMGAYNCSKAAVVALSETLAAECAGTNVGVSVLCPSWVKTRINDPVRYGVVEQSEVAAAPSDNPLVIDPQQVAADIEEGMSPDQIADDVIKAMATGQLHILTHADTQPLVQARFDHIGSAYA